MKNYKSDKRKMSHHLSVRGVHLVDSTELLRPAGRVQLTSHLAEDTERTERGQQTVLTDCSLNA